MGVIPCHGNTDTIISIISDKTTKIGVQIEESSIRKRVEYSDIPKVCRESLHLKFLSSIIIFTKISLYPEFQRHWHERIIYGEIKINQNL